MATEGAGGALRQLYWCRGGRVWLSAPVRGLAAKASVALRQEREVIEIVRDESV